jgi:IS1 family transposase
MAHISNTNTLKSIYYAHFHSITEYGIVFWDNSSKGWKIFTSQKKFIRIMAGAQPRTSCKSLLKQLEILSLSCQYLFSLSNFIINIQEIFQTNLSIHNIKTRNKHHLHRPNDKLSCFQKRMFYAGIKILRFTL